MKRLYQSVVIAFSMYSAVPMPRVDWDRDNMRYALCFFPLVGGLIGGAVYGWLWFCAAFGVSPALAAAVATALPALLTGGIHLDGFCDTVDALASHAPTERKLEILKDPHTGAFALIGCNLYLLLQFGLWSQYRFRPETAAVVALGFVFSRTLSGMSVVSFRCAKTSGLAAQFSEAAARGHVYTVLFFLVWAGAFGMLYLSLIAGAASLLAALLLFWYYKWTAYNNFGGITGDLAGYFLQLCEIGMLAAVVFFGGIKL